MDPAEHDDDASEPQVESEDESGRAALEADLRRQLAAVFGANRWLCTDQMETGAAVMVRQVLLAAGWTPEIAADGAGEAVDVDDPTPMGTDHVLGLGVIRGTGEIDSELPVLGLGRAMTGDIMTDIRNIGRNLSDLPADIQDRIDRWDPDHGAKVIVPFTVVEGDVAGRPTFGARSTTWERLEDKLAIIDVWRAAGLDQAPTSIIELTDVDRALTAHRRVAAERGSVVAVDNQQGWHGGATGTHWVRSEEEMVDLLERLNGHERARVMPFLDGVPCSIHGMVLPDRTVAFRPCEMMVFLDEDAGRLHYGQVSTFWNPDEAARETMRRAAIQLGEELRRRVGFRGVFTLDGVLTDDGFRPTEVNPRYGAALPALLEAADGSVVNLYLINLAVVEGLLTIDADGFECWVTSRIDQNPRGRSMAATFRAPDVESGRKGTIESDGRELRVINGEREDEADDPWQAVAQARWGPEGQGGRVMLTLTEHVPVGPPTAPLAVRMLQVLDAEWNMGLPPLVAASA